MNYNAHGLSAVPVSTFWTPWRVGSAAAAASVVIVVIISSLWSLKLRAQKWVGPGLLLPSPGVPKSRQVQPDVFPSVALGFLPAVLRPGFWEAGSGLWVGLLSLAQVGCV